MYAIGSNVVLHTIKSKVDGPTALVFNTSDSSLYSLNHHYSPFVGVVMVYAAGGRYLRSITDGVTDASALAVDGTGNVYVANYGTPSSNSGSISVYSAGKNGLLYTIADDKGYPIALTVDGSMVQFICAESGLLGCAILRHGVWRRHDDADSNNNRRSVSTGCDRLRSKWKLVRWKS